MPRDGPLGNYPGGDLASQRVTDAVSYVLLAKIFQREACVFENSEKEALRKITPMKGNHQHRTFGVLQNPMGARLAGLAIAFSL